MSKRIVVVGSINLDLVVRVARQPVPGETVAGLSFDTFGGGKGANQAFAIARLGGEVSMIGRLGNDPFAARLRDGLTSACVDMTLVEEVQGASGTALIVTTQTGENSIVVVAGANALLTPRDLDHQIDSICEASIVLTQLEVPIETVNRLAEITRAAGVPLMLDPAPYQTLSPALLSAVTWLTPNENEARLLIGDDRQTIDRHSAPAIAKRLLGMGVRNLLLTMGAQGVYLAGADVETCYLPAPLVTAIDSTAAGDTFNGAFAHALTVQRMPPVQAAEFAMTAAAISVTRPGAQSSMPTMIEVKSFNDFAEIE